MGLFQTMGCCQPQKLHFGHLLHKILWSIKELGLALSHGKSLFSKIGQNCEKMAKTGKRKGLEI